MAKVPVFSETQEFWMKLEAERNDLTYLEPKKDNRPEPIVTVVKEKVYLTTKQRDQRDKIFYHAGRAAQGATDRVALEAAKWLEELSE